MDRFSRSGFWSGLLCAGLVFLSACQIVNADNKSPNDPNDLNYPEELLRNTWEAVVSILQKEDLDQEDKEKKIRKIVTPIFDFPLMAKLALGRRHWPKFNPPQRKKFTRLFTERLKKSYRKKIMLYKDEGVLFKPTIKKKKTIYIPTELIHKDKRVAILYKLRKIKKRWKIYDVEIQGVSIILTYRSQFNEILRRDTVEDLLSRLQKPPE